MPLTRNAVTFVSCQPARSSRRTTAIFVSNCIPGSGGLPPRPGHELDLFRAENLGAARNEPGDHRLPVRLAAQQPRRLLAQMRVAPLAQRRQGDVELAALRGEPVIEEWRALAVRDVLQASLRHTT